MKKVQFTANLQVVRARAAEEGGASSLACSLSMAKPNRKALSALCEKPEEALQALDTATEAGGKVEIPAGRETCAVTVAQGSKTLDIPGAKFKKVVVDARGGECQVRIVYQHDMTIEGASFYARNLGHDIDLVVVPQQGTIEDEIEAKKGDKAEKEEE